ncbi:UDP-glucuronate:xylan alpha-glucuronosyltransferase 2 [Glycine soja]
MLEVNPKPRPRPRPVWFDVIAKGIINNKNKITVGLVNIDARVDGNILKQLDALHSQVETIYIDFDHVDKNFKWEDIFPERIDENGKWGLPKCPNLPMPALQNYGDLNVVMAKVPCKEGWRIDMALTRVPKLA